MAYIFALRTRAQVAGGGGGNILAVVILLDHCSNPAFLQAGFLCTLPHCLIAERPVYSNTIGSTISHISEFTSGAKVLTKEIEKCIPQFGDVKPMSPFACVVPAMPQQISKISLSRSKGSIYINKTEFMNQSAKAQYNVFNAMIEAILHDFQNETTTYLKIYQLADILNESSSNVVISEEQIRRALHNIKKTLEQMDILPKKVFNQTYGLGYRLNHKNVNLELCQKEEWTI